MPWFSKEFIRACAAAAPVLRAQWVPEQLDDVVLVSDLDLPSPPAGVIMRSELERAVPPEYRLVVAHPGYEDKNRGPIRPFTLDVMSSDVVFLNRNDTYTPVEATAFSSLVDEMRRRTGTQDILWDPTRGVWA